MTTDTEFEAWVDAHVPLWLGRDARAEDGVPSARVDAAEARLRTAVPPPLRLVYERVGAVASLMSAFERFADPEEWELRDGRLMFLVENQDVCAWGVDGARAIWMETDDFVFGNVRLALADFLQLILVYQLAQGGWPHTVVRDVPNDEARTVCVRLAGGFGWPMLADHDRLWIADGGSQLLWALLPEDGAAGETQVFVTAREEAVLAPLTERYGFDEL